MRGTTIFVLASLVLPNFVTAVPVTGQTASLNVIPDVKRHAETTEDLVKRSLEAILLPHDAEALVERNRGIRPGRKSRSTGELVDRARGVARPGSNSRSADGETAELVGRGRVVKPTKKRDTESTEDLVERGRVVRPGTKRDAEATEDLVERGRVVRPGTKRDAEATEDLVERGRVVRPGTKRDAEATEDLVERGRGMRPGQTRDLESFEYLAEEITV